MRHLNDWITNYLKYVEDTEPDLRHHEWTALSILSMVLQRKVWMEKASEIWYPNLYTLLVGDSASRKGTAMKFGGSILRKSGIDLTLASTKGSTSDLIFTLKSSTNTFLIYGKQYIHSSMSVFAPEFVNFILKENVTDIINVLNDVYDCLPIFEYGTRSYEKEKAENVCFSILGAITPEHFKNSLPLEAIGGGFLSRLIMIHGERKKKNSNAKLIEAMEPQLAEDLRDIHQLKGPFVVHETFSQLYDNWYENEGTPEDLKHHYFSSYVERRQVHLCKMAMILCASEGSEMVIRDRHFSRALDFLRRAEMKMGRIFEGYGKSKHSDVLMNIIKYLHDNGTVYRTALIRTFAADIDSVSQLDDMLRTWKEAGAISSSVNGSEITITYIPRNKRRRR